jgi:hypothetical protein
MNSTKDRADLEARLRSMFDSKTRTLAIPDREPDEVAGVPEWPSTRRRAPYIMAAALVAAVVITAVAVGATTGHRVDTNRGPAAPQPAAGGVQPIHFETALVSMAADAFSIDVRGKTFSTSPPVDVHGDPCMRNEYTTLELTWHEHDVEMRLYVYFKSDGRDWWSNEIRTYDGAAQGEWVVYHGEFFRQPLGTPFVGNLDITGLGEHGTTADGVTGELHLTNLHLLAFRRPAVCTNPTGRYALVASETPITMSVSPSGGYGVLVTLMDTTNCTPVDVGGAFNYRWAVQDPSIVAVTPDGTRAEVRAIRAGRTVLHVSALDPSGGTVVTETDIEVAVTP